MRVRAWNEGLVRGAVAAALIAGMVLAFTVALFGQRLRVELADGRVLDTREERVVAPGVVYGWRVLRPGEHIRAYIRATGVPVGLDPSSAASVLIARAALSAPPGWLVVDAEQIDARRFVHLFTGAPLQHEGEDVWVLRERGDRSPQHSAVPESATHFLLDGGRSIWWDVVAPGVDPFPMPDLASPEVARVRHFLGVTGIPVPEPLRQTVWTFTREDVPYNLLDWNLRRFGNPSRIQTVGLHEWGRVPWGDVDCNGHYDMVAACLELALRTGDPGAWRAASTLARHFFQWGFIDSKGHDWSRMHVYEKTGGLRQYTGDNTRPADSHEWDFGPAAWALISDDGMAQAAMRRRADRINGDAAWVVWNGAGGCRQLGWRLRNLRALDWLGFGDTKPGMRTLLEHAFYVNAQHGKDWWVNIYGTGLVFAPWMQALTNVEVVSAIAHLGGPGATPPEWSSEVQRLIRFQLDHTVQLLPDGSARVPHGIGDARDPATYGWSYTATQCAWVLPQAWIGAHWWPDVKPKVNGLRKTILAGAPKWNEMYAVGGGPAALKTWASAWQWGSRELIW